VRLAAARTEGGTRAVRVEDDRYVDLGAVDVSALLEVPGWCEVAAGADSTLRGTPVGLALVVPLGRPRRPSAPSSSPRTSSPVALAPALQLTCPVDGEVAQKSRRR
jgi:hypothetical protein